MDAGSEARVGASFGRDEGSRKARRGTGQGRMEETSHCSRSKSPESRSFSSSETYHFLLLQRGTTLGEPTIPQPKKSVFDYLSQKDKDRLQNFRKFPSDPSSATPAPAPPKPAVKPYIAPTTAPTAKAALLGFKPFSADPLRHARYTAYLEYHASPPPPNTPPPASLGLLADQSAEQFNREMEDYAKAAAIFKPVSGAMAGRFVGASTTVIGGGPIIEGGLYQPTFETKAEG